MTWNEYPTVKPESDLVAYVTNIRANNGCYIATYDKARDVFLVATLAGYNSMPINVTHWIDLPVPPTA